MTCSLIDFYKCTTMVLDHMVDTGVAVCMWEERGV